MKISYNWLKQYTNTDLSIDKASEILTNIGLEVEGVETFQSVKGGLEGLVIGEVTTCVKHPNADSLSCTTVDVGTDELLSIVCGAPNIDAGQKVVVAPVGTVLYDGDDNFKIKKTKIRGELSLGMICAEDEIGLGKDHDGIMVLDAEAKTGTPAKEFFKIETDTIFEIGLTPNRIDGASHIGTARDLSAYLKHIGEKSELLKPDVSNFAVDNNDYVVDVNIETSEACKRYSGLTISNITVKESPDWLKIRLASIGQKSINNIVDITNFVMYETGQPLHAFDGDKVIGDKIIVKTLPKGSKFVTLDDTERELSDEDLMICNTENGMCIAGVFGGKDSGVTENTTKIFIESANFDPVYVRKTSKRHTLSTDSSFRFERGADPNNTVYALKRAALLIKELANGKISSNIVDIYPVPVEDFEVNLKYNNVDRLIGKKIERPVIKNILTSLDIKIIEDNDDGLLLNVPPYRVDVKREADVIEEILRIYGYNNIEISEHVNSTIQCMTQPDEHKLQNQISDFLSNNGFNEAMSNSQTKASYYDNKESYKTENTVKILNPLSSDLNALRQTLLFGGLEAVAYNINHKSPNLKIYEFGNCYHIGKDNELQTNEKPHLKGYGEEHHLAMFLSGNNNTPSWILKDTPTNFYKLKSFVDGVLQQMRYDIDKINVENISDDIFGYGLKYSLVKRGKTDIIIPLVSFGVVNYEISKNKEFDIETDVLYADFNWDTLISNYPTAPTYKPLPKYPEVRRDLALLIDKSVSFGQIKEIAKKTEKRLLKKINIFDVFEGENIGKDKKSYAVSFYLQDINKTLTDKQIDKITNNLIKAFEKELNANIR